jgi:hypothetical protein
VELILHLYFLFRKEARKMDVDRKCVEALVNQAIEYHIFHSLEEDIQSAEIKEQKKQLEQLSIETKDKHNLNANEVYRVVLGTKKQLQTIYLNKESLVEMMSDERNYDILLHKVQFAIERNSNEEEYQLS